MREDPIVAEVRRVREAILAGFGDDLEAYAESLKRVQQEEKRGVRYLTAPLASPARALPTPPELI